MARALSRPQWDHRKATRCNVSGNETGRVEGPDPRDHVGGSQEKQDRSYPHPPATARPPPTGPSRRLARIRLRVLSHNTGRVLVERMVASPIPSPCRCPIRRCKTTVPPPSCFAGARPSPPPSEHEPATSPIPVHCVPANLAGLISHRWPRQGAGQSYPARVSRRRESPGRVLAKSTRKRCPAGRRQQGPRR